MARTGRGAGGGGGGCAKGGGRPDFLTRCKNSYCQVEKAVFGHVLDVHDSWRAVGGSRAAEIEKLRNYKH